MRIIFIILVGTSLFACKPAPPIMPVSSSSQTVVMNTATTLPANPTPTMLPALTQDLAVTPSPAPVSPSPGWTTYPNILSIKKMLFDQVGNLWAVGPDGVYVIKPDGAQLHITVKEGLPGNDLLSIGQDTSNAIWVGSNGKGAARFDGHQWQIFTTSDGLAGDVVRNITRYSRATGVLIGTNHGVSWYDNNRQVWKNFTGSSNLEIGEVSSIVVLPHDDTVWIATRQGVRQLEATRGFSVADGLASNSVNDIAFGPDCSLWVGTDQGVSTYNGEGWTSYTAADGLVNNNVSAAAVALDGVAWFATPFGVSRFDGKTWMSITTRDGLADNNVLSILVAPNDTLWIGTSGGLSHYSPSLASQGNEIIKSPQGIEASDSEFPLIYLKGGDLWTWSAGEKKQATYYGNITGFFLSGDCSKVAVFRRGEINETSLWVMDLDGSDMRLLVSQDDLDALGKFSETDESRQTNSRVSFRGTAWVPGTLTIAYGTHRYIKYDGTIEHNDLNLVNTENGEKKTLLPPGQGGAFTYSPDGSKIAVSGQNQLSIMDADGSDRHDKVLEYPTIHDIDNYYYPSPQWSADGTYLLLALPPEEPMEDPTPPTTLWKIPADGSPAVRLGSISPSFTYAFYVAYSPDQTHLAYWSLAYGPSGPTGEIHFASYDGSDDHVVIAGKVSYFVSWSPDGQHFIYYTSTPDPEVWYISDLDGVTSPMAYKPIYITWVSKDLFMQTDSLPCGGYELRLTTLDGESQLIDRYR